jgi:hypothetical protein
MPRALPFAEAPATANLLGCIIGSARVKASWFHTVVFYHSRKSNDPHRGSHCKSTLFATTELWDATVSERHPDLTLLCSFIGCSRERNGPTQTRIASQRFCNDEIPGCDRIRTASWSHTSSFNTEWETQWTDSNSHRKSTLLQRRNSRMRPCQNGILISHFCIHSLDAAGKAMICL